MENYTAQQMDDLCGRLERLADQVKNPGLTTREDVVVSEVVGVIQRIGEGVAWAYGQHRSKPGLGERFAQPFVDHHIKEWLKALLVEKRPLRRENQNRLVGQILQTIHILLQATPPDSMLFCNLTAGWYLNEVVSAKIDFLDNEDLLPLWMTVVKDIATMLDRDNLMLFFDPSSDKPFPIFSEACRYYHHPVSQVRTHVQATSLEIFLKLRDKSFWNEPLFHKVLQESSVFFTHVCCLLRDFWQMADEAVHTQERRNVRSALYIQNDILMYVNDIFMCEIPQLTAILQEKLLRFAILPVLVRSILRPRDPPTIREQQQDLLSAPTAWYLLHDMLVTLQSSPVFTAVSLALLRKDVPEEVLKLVTEHHSRTPITYFKTQAEWGGTIRPAPDLTGDVASDEVLYAMPREHLVQLLENRGHMVKNSLLDALLERLQGLSRSESGLSAVADSLLLDTTTLLLRTLRAGSEVLDEDVAERLSASTCEVLAQHRQLPWPTLEAALLALRELIAVIDNPQGRARRILAPYLRDKVLVPLATELLQAAKPPGSDSWLQEFTEQWAAQHASLTEPAAAARQRDLVEPGVGLVEAPGVPTGRARCLRVLLGAWHLEGCLLGGADRLFDRMPGFSDADVEEFSSYEPGVSVHIGKMNRVKCHARTARHGEPEALYLLPVQSSLVLVRPDDQKPFWALPVVAESLLHVRLLASTDKMGPLEQIPSPGSNGDELQRILKLEVSSPRSPFLRSFGLDGVGKDRIGCSLVAAPPPGGQMDPMTMSVPVAPGAAPGVSQGPMSGADAAAGKDGQLVLHFSDERRRRLACKILVQAKHHIAQRASDGVETFLKGIKSGGQL